MCFSGSLDSELTLQLYRGFTELVEANETARKSSVKTSPISPLLPRRRAELSDSQVANGAGQRESLLSSWSTSSKGSPAVNGSGGATLGYENRSSNDVTISPLTGTRLVSRSANEDVASQRSGKCMSSPSYSNGLTTESLLRGTSSAYSDRLMSHRSSLNRFEGANDSRAARIVNGSAGGTLGYGDRSSDVVVSPLTGTRLVSRSTSEDAASSRVASSDAATSSYLARSRQNDLSSPAAQLQSLRDSYSSTMWNDSAASRLSSAAWGGVDSLSPFDTDPTPTAAASSRYEKVMSARSRSAIRRGDVTRDSVRAAATRSRLTSPVAAARCAVNDLSEMLQSSAVEQSAIERSPPFTLSSRAERMKSYSVGTTPKTDLHDSTTSTTVLPPSTITTTDNSRTQLSQTKTLPSYQHYRPTTTATHTASETGYPKTEKLANGTETPLRTEISETTAVDQSITQRDSALLPSANTSKPVTVNGDTKVRESRLHSVTSSAAAGHENTQKNSKLTTLTNGLKTETFEAKSATSPETNRQRMTDTDDIAGSSLSAATLYRLQAAAAAAADAVSMAGRSRVESTGETVKASPTSVKETVLSPSSSSEHRTRAINGDANDKPVPEAILAPQPSPTSRARSRTPFTMQEMLVPSAGQTNAKTPSPVNRMSDAVKSGPGRQLNDAPFSPSSKAAKPVDSASRPASAKGGNGVKSRSRKLVDVHDMLIPSSGSGSGSVSSKGDSKTERESMNLPQTSSNTTTSTSRVRTSSTSSTTENKPENAEPPKPTKPGSQPLRKPVPSSDAATRSAANTADRASTRRLTASSISLQHTPSTPASKVIRDSKTTGKTTTGNTKRSSGPVSKTPVTTDEDNWEATVADIIQASADTAETIQPSPAPSMSSLQSEPVTTSRTRRTSASEGLSSLMRPTASSMARRGSASDTDPPLPSSARRGGYAAPTSSSASKSLPSGMSRTTSSPALRVGSSLSTPRRAAATGTSSGRTTPTGSRLDAATPQGSVRPARTTNTPSARPPPRPGTTTTPGRTTTPTNSVQRGTAGARTSVGSRSRNNSTSSNSSDTVASRR